MSDAINRLLAQNVVDKSSGELLEGVRIIPPGQLINLAQYFVENLLPRIEKRLGRDHAEYENMLMAVHAILYCLTLLDKWESAEKKLAQTKRWARLVNEENERLESELTKYTAIENAMTSGTIEMYQKVLQKKSVDWIQELLKRYGKKEK